MSYTVTESVATLKKLPIELFGRLIEVLYASEINFSLEWMWDGGMDWSFSQISYNGKQEHPELIQSYMQGELKDKLNDVEVVAGLIIAEYFMLGYNGKDSEGRLNSIGSFLADYGFLESDRIMDTSERRRLRLAAAPLVRHMKTNFDEGAKCIITDDSIEIPELNLKLHNVSDMLRSDVEDIRN